MTTVTTTPSMADSAAAPVVAGVPVTALAFARAEGRRLLRHPAHLAGVAMAAVFLLLVQEVVGDTRDAPMVVWTGIGLFPLAAGTFLASFGATIRSRRHGTDELYGTLPAPGAVRTAGHLLAVAWPTAGSILLLAVAAVRHQLWDGVLVPTPDGVVAVVPTVSELALGPLLVAFFGVLAVVVGRWVPSLLAMPVAAVVLLLHFVTGSWGVGGSGRWFLPLVTHQQSAGWVQVTPGYGYDLVAGFDRVPFAWHELYVLALGGVLAGLALLRHGRTRPRLVAIAACATVAAVAGVLQLP